MHPVAVILAIAAGGWCPGAFAQAPAYPAKPVRLIVPWPAGGGADVIARTTAAKLAEALGQNVIVDNRAGAAGIIGTEAAARAAPDGYTLYQGTAATLTIGPALRPPPYDPVKDFAPISMLNAGTLVVITHPSLPVKSIRDLVQLAKARPGTINFASSGTGSLSHLVGEMFKSDAGVNLSHVPYKGAAPAMIELLAGHVDMMFSEFITSFPHMKAGKLRALAVTAGKRSPLMPEIPTIRESGGPDLQAISWSALFAPAGTPPAIVQRLNAEIVKIAASADFQERMRASGGTPASSTPEELAKHIRGEIVRYARAVKESGTKVE